ncbi:hypothetical protein EJB05_50917 [Eragrostis curvula]|nr:hypothetical protein EJB05_50917 [Eragrostis curvula]
MLKVKKIQEVVFVNCRWPFDMVDFPINSLDCESLEQIRLCFVKISNSCLNYVNNLTTMDLACCSMTTLDLYALVYQCKSLRELKIGIYEGNVIRIDSASLESLHVWQSTIRKLAVQNAAKLQKILVEADPQKTVVVAAGPKKPSPCVGVWIADAPILTDACFNISTQSVTINNISTMTDNGPLSSLRKLMLHISLQVKKEKKVLENFMKSCLRLRELTLWREDEVYVDEHSDALNDDWLAKLRNLSSILNLQLLTLKDYKGGDIELAIASAVLEYAPSLHELTLETNGNDEEIFTGAKAKLREVTQASANASVKYIIGLRDCNSFFSDGG